jgi:hypothetical protein
MVYLFDAVHIRFVLSYTKIEGLRICKVHVGGNKWCIYFMLFTYGLFRLTRRSEVYVFVKFM